MYSVVLWTKLSETVMEMGFSQEEAHAIHMALFLSSACVLSEDNLSVLSKTYRASQLHPDTLKKLEAMPYKERPFQFDPYDYPNEPKRFAPKRQPKQRP